MVRLRPGGVQRELRTVFTSGTVAGLTDAELLDRFLRRRDDGASFEALVARHGPMVLGVCRDLLGDEHAADDAFQATFLVLVRKAGSVRVGDSLGRWLHGVAHRVARHARCDAARRRRREEAVEGASTTVSTPAADAERAELRAALHDELARLPASFRAPIVLCHLEGLTHEEAAQQLRCPVGTVRSRLARGRDRLRVRLVRRGVAPAVVLAVLEWSSRAAVPATLVASTAGAAARFAGGAGVGAISTTVLSLTKGVLFSMTLGPLKVAATGLMAVGLISVAATGVVAQQGKPAAIPSAKPERSPSLVTKSLQPASADLKGDAEKERTDTLALLDDLSSLKDELNRDVGAARDLFGQGHVDAAQAVLKSLQTKAWKTAMVGTAQGIPSPAVSKSRTKVVNPLAQRPDTEDPFKPDAFVDSPASPSSQELIGEYRSAQQALKPTEELYKRGEVNLVGVNSDRARLNRAFNRIEGQVERYRDELELLRVQLKKQEAEVFRARGQIERATAMLSLFKRARETGAGPLLDVAKGESEVGMADGALKVAQADQEIVQVQIRQAERRLAPLQRFLESEKPANTPAGAGPKK
jgi:RNA polymerase sigma factor (sigma-70 family)